MKTPVKIDFTESLAARSTQDLTGGDRPFLIAVCGGADTGKSTLAASLRRVFKTQSLEADVLSTDAFLKSRHARQALGLSGFDPASVDKEEMTRAIDKLSRGVFYTYFPYVNRTGAHAHESTVLVPRDIVVVEGIHALHPVLAARMNYKIYIDAPIAALKELRIKANVEKRGMHTLEARSRVDFEMQDFLKYTAPVKQSADCLISVSSTYDYEFVDRHVEQ